MSNMKCPNCSWSGSIGELIHTTDLIHRLSPGDIVPEGECPECGALVSDGGPLIEAAPKLLVRLSAITYAAKIVEDNWSRGDLAAAVRELAHQSSEARLLLDEIAGRKS